MIYSKNKIVEYVEKWCWENGLNYTKKSVVVIVDLDI